MQKPKHKIVSAAVDPSLLDQIDELADAWARQRPGAIYSRSDVVRALLMSGLAAAKCAA